MPQDALAADAVVQFATNKLGFKLEDISVYGWSIGGFTASWLGMNYKGLGAMGWMMRFSAVVRFLEEG